MPLAKPISDLPADALRLVSCENDFNGTILHFYSTQIPVRRWFLTKNNGRDTLRRVPNFEASASRTRSSASLPFRDPANSGCRFIPILLGGCALPDTLRRYNFVDFRKQFEAAFAVVLANRQSAEGTMKLCFVHPILPEGRAFGAEPDKNLRLGRN